MAWKIIGDLTTETIDGVPNVVTGCEWGYELADAVRTVTMRGTVTFTYNPASPFIQYADLTEATVVGWVQGVLGPDAVAFQEAKAVEMLALQTEQEGPINSNCWAVYTQVEDKPAPWAA